MAANAPFVVRNTAKEKMLAGEVATALSVRLTQTIEIVGIARTAGFDALYVDMEHSQITMAATSQICTAALDTEITPFVRVPSAIPDNIARCLDGGALGVIVPQIRTAADARGVVDAAKYPPVGARSVSSSLPQLRYRPVPVAESNRLLNEVTMVIAMIETADALENLDEIASVDGIDMLLIGGNDLTTELGIPGEYDHDRALDAYDRIGAACRRAGKLFGVAGLAARPGITAKLVADGARFVSVGTDMGLMLSAATKVVDGFKAVRSS